MKDFHTERATVALRKLAEQDVTFASLSLYCKHRDASENLKLPGSPGGEGAPAWTDGKVIHYGPKFATFTLEEQMGVCAHEIMHIAFRHISRAKQLRKRFGDLYDNFIFNIATDAIINETLLLAGRKLPRPCIVLTELLKEVFDEKVSPEDAIGEWDSEKLYIRLINEREKRGGGKGQGKGQGQGQGSAPGKGGSQGQDGEGSGQNEVDKILEELAKKNGFENDFMPNMSEDPSDAQEDSEWQQRVARAMAQGKMAGTGIGRIGHKLADIPKTTTPWEVILRSVVSKAVTRKPRPSFERPTRNFLAMDADAVARGARRPVYQQGMVKNANEPKVVVGVDVSGSISDLLLQQFAGEIAGIGRRTGAEIHVLVFDTKVLSHTKMEGQSWETELTQIDFARGGGTCFVDVVNKAQELDPSIIVVLTDLYGPFGEQPGNTPVIWAIPDDKPPHEPPFGRVLSMAR